MSNNIQKFPLDARFRLKNFDKYVRHSHELGKLYDVCLLILTYNSILSLSKLLNAVVDNPVDITIIDNNSNDGTLDFIKTNYINRVNFLQLHNNEGGAGGYAVGQEWVLSKGYKYCLITEDDTLPCSNNLISEMLKFASENVIVQSRYNGLKGQLFTLHFALYPTRIFDRAGVINSNLFYRYEDYEYGLRLQKAALELNMDAICINEYYNHPYLKLGFSVLPTYFMIRNALLVFCSLGNIRTPLKMIFANINLGIYTFLNNGNLNFLALNFSAIFDFFFFDISKNQFTLKKYKGLEIRPNANFTINKCSVIEFVNSFQGYSVKTKLWDELPEFFPSGNFGSGYRKVILGKYIMPISVIAGLAKDIVFIEEIDLNNKSLSYWKFKNSSRIKGFFRLIFSVAFSSLIMLIIAPLILIYALYFYTKTRNFYPKPLFNKLFSRSWDSRLQEFVVKKNKEIYKFYDVLVFAYANFYFIAIG